MCRDIAHDLREILGGVPTEIAREEGNFEFEAYGRVGYARSEIKPNANTSNITYSREDKQNELTYGLGARWMFAKSFGVFGEWMKNDKIEVDSYMVGVDFRF
jgi:hypothetical protein